MMIKKPFGKKVLSIILVIVITITPFSYVKADTHTIDDLYNALRNILIVLNGYGQSMPTDGINDQIQDLQDLFDTIFVDNTYSYTSGAAGTVTNRTFMDLMEEIATLSFSIPQNIMEGYYLSDQSGTIHKINGLADMLDDITDFLSEIDAGQSINETRLRSIMNSTSSILTTLNTVSTTISNILTTDNNIYNIENNFYNYIRTGTFKQDLDNTIDKITWSQFGDITYYKTIGGDAITSNGDLEQDYVYVKLSTYPQNNNIMLLTLNVDKYSSGFFDITNVEIYDSNNNKLSDVLYYFRPIRVNNYLYIYDILNRVPFSNVYFKISFNTNGYLYYTASSSVMARNKMFIIYQQDIEYWSLMSYFDLHQLLKDYESVNSSELDKLKQENTNLQTTITNFTNIENQITTNFSNNLVTFNSNLTESTTLFGHITASVVWFSQQMQNIFDVSSDFKMLLIMPMILGIALWFIGRGSFILRSSGKKGKGGNSS